MNKYSCSEEKNEIILHINKEDFVKYDPDKASLEDWISNHLTPLVYDLSMEKIKYIIENKTPTLIYFIKYSDPEFTKSYNIFYLNAKKYNVKNKYY